MELALQKVNLNMHSVWAQAPTNVHIYNQSKQKADPRGHAKCVQQGLTDGHIVIMGHYCQHITFCTDKEAIEKYLTHAFLIGDGVYLRHKVYQQFGITEINRR
jgi:hypothetical protein